MREAYPSCLARAVSAVPGRFALSFASSVPADGALEREPAPRGIVRETGHPAQYRR